MKSVISIVDIISTCLTNHKWVETLIFDFVSLLLTQSNLEESKAVRMYKTYISDKIEFWNVNESKNITTQI
jgi:hypothetical protein